MKLNIQLYGGRGASSSNIKIEVGKQYINNRGTILNIVGKTPKGNFEYIEMGSRGVATESELKQIIKENNYATKNYYTDKEIADKEEYIEKHIGNASFQTIQRWNKELETMKKNRKNKR